MNEDEKIDLIIMLLDNLGKGTFRGLIYGALELSEKAYVPLYNAGLLYLNNEVEIIDGKVVINRE